MVKSSRGEPGRASVELDVLRDATGGDRDLMQELAELYVSDSDLQLRALDDALQNKELDRIRRIAAALESSSASVGAVTAAGIFRELGQAAREGDADRIRRTIDEGVDEFERVRKSLADLR